MEIRKSRNISDKNKSNKKHFFKKIHKIKTPGQIGTSVILIFLQKVTKSFYTFHTIEPNFTMKDDNT